MHIFLKLMELYTKIEVWFKIFKGKKVLWRNLKQAVVVYYFDHDFFFQGHCELHN